MTSKIWRKRALMLGLASLAALPLSAARASELRTASRVGLDLPTWTSARSQPGAASWTLAAKSSKPGKWGERGGSRGSKSANDRNPAP
jgi:hypothetical protein